MTTLKAKIVAEAEKEMLDAKEKWMMGYDHETCFSKLGLELFNNGALFGARLVLDELTMVRHLLAASCADLDSKCNCPYCTHRREFDQLSSELKDDK